MKLGEIFVGTVGGSVNGFAQVLSGHPLDTIKVHLQTKGRYDIGLRHLYRGIVYPLLFNVPTVSVQFGTENIFSQMIKKSDDEFTWSDGFISGALTGITAAPLISVMELYRIRRQTFINSKKFPINLGLGCTVLREIPAVSAYFGVYRYMFDQLKNHDFYSRSFISGSLAGSTSWLINYPMDVIKTRIQSAECNTIKEAFYKGKLWKGVGICTLRGAITNGFGFVAYESFTKFILSMK
jgi:solute carrier family 25 carnitine/acylcarnitine transporter 20/29